MAGRTDNERVLRWASAVLVGFLVVGSTLVLASLVVRPTERERGSATLSSSPTRSESTVAPSATASATPAAATMTEAGMTAFVEDYLATAARDPARSWTSLTPKFQRASGGFASYDAFWGPVARATASGVFADPDEARVTYRVTYVDDAGRTTGDSTRLELLLDDGRYLIDGEG